MSKFKTFFLLHLLLMLYSSGGIFSKLAGSASFFSWKFCLCYGIIIAILGVYAIGWQQVIKQIPLTTAFANKAVTVVWGIVWGVIFFHEKESITLGKIVGCILVMVGVIIFAKTDEENENVE